MSKAIGLRFVDYDESKHAECHFLGDPVIPKSMMNDFDDDVMFLGMIPLEKIAALDPENKLPHKGTLYFFLDTSGTSRRLFPIVRHTLETPTVMLDGFNEPFSEKEFPGIRKPRGVEFVEVDEGAEGCKLLGVPCDWNYEKEPENPLLLTISHFDEGLDFLPFLDGYTYIFFGPKGKKFDGATGFYEYS